MVRQAYINRLALGRSAYEPLNERPDAEEADPDHDVPVIESTSHHQLPGSFAGGETVRPAAESRVYRQRHNALGHPENMASRAHARRLRRAQNDVLSTVGVCVYVDENGNIVANPDGREQTADEKAAVEAISRENEAGLWIDLTDDLFHQISTSFIRSQRKRIQTFAFYSQIPLAHIIKTEWRLLGPMEYLFAGEMASLIYGLVALSLHALAEMLRDYLESRYLNQEDGLERRWTPFLIRMSEKSLIAAGYVILAPLHVFASLQRLHLIPGWSLWASPFRYEFFRCLFPPMPSQVNGASLMKYAVSLAFCPLATSLYGMWFATKFESKLSVYIRAILPRPDNPDGLSLKRSGSQSVPVQAMEYPKKQSSLGDELRQDAEYLVETFKDLRQNMVRILRTIFGGPSTPTLDPDSFYLDEDSEMPSLLSPTMSSQGPEGDRESPPEGPVDISLPRVAVNMRSFEEDTTYDHTPTTSEDPESPLLHPSNVQIRTRSGSTSTLHMDVEVNGPGPVFTSSFAASPRTTIIDSSITHIVSDPRHRVTALSLHASEALGIRLAGSLSAFARLPFEALFFRSLARNFISGPNISPSPLWLGPQIYPLCYPMHQPTGSPTGSPTWAVASDYASKILLCVAMKTVLSVQTWSIGNGVALWMGKTWFDWGKL